MSEKEKQVSQFEFLREKSEALCKKLGLPDNFIIRIYQEVSDWAFVVQIDLLHETACREILRKFLKLEVNGKVIENKRLDKFIDGLPINGKSSITNLLEASGCPKDLLNFIRNLRRVRNCYAHDIKKIDQSILQTIKEQDNFSQVLESFSAVQPAGYDEKTFLSQLSEEPKMLRFGILSEALRFLALAYMIAYQATDSEN